MTNPEIAQKIRSVAYALDNVQVKGRENMDVLLGCIQTLERMAGELVRLQAEPVPADEDETSK